MILLKLYNVTVFLLVTRASYEKTKYFDQHFADVLLQRSLFWIPTRIFEITFLVFRLYFIEYSPIILDYYYYKNYGISYDGIKFEFDENFGLNQLIFITNANIVFGLLVGF